MVARAVRATDRLGSWLPWPKRPQTCFFTLRPTEGGPGTFARKLGRAFRVLGISAEFSRLRSAQAALVFSVSWGDWFYRLCRRWDVRVALRMDGFYIPSYFDNRLQPQHYQDRRLTLNAMAINQRLQRDLLLSDFVIYQSEFSKHMADRFLYHRRDRYSVVFNGVDLQQFSPGSRGVRRRRLLAAGSLRDEYMLSTVLAVFDRVWQKHDLELLVVGSMTPICQQQIEEFYKARPIAAERICVVGPVDNDAMPDYFRQADILVHPRLGDWCPNVVIEAMACGLPVVCGSWGGSAELVGQAGVVAPTEEWSYGDKYQADLSEAVEKILDRLDIFAEAARSRAESVFDIRRIARRYARNMGLLHQHGPE